MRLPKSWPWSLWMLILIALLAAVTAGILLTRDAGATSCLPTDDALFYNEARSVLVGTVVEVYEVEGHPNPYPGRDRPFTYQIATIDVERYWKAPVPPRVRVGAVAWVQPGVHFGVGERHLVALHPPIPDIPLAIDGSAHGCDLTVWIDRPHTISREGAERRLAWLRHAHGGGHIPQPMSEPAGGLWFTNGCNVCHGDRGEGWTAPGLSGTDLLPEEMQTLLAQARAPHPRLDAADALDVYLWLRTLEVVEPKPGAPVTGYGVPERPPQITAAKGWLAGTISVGGLLVLGSLVWWERRRR